MLTLRKIPKANKNKITGGSSVKVKTVAIPKNISPEDLSKVLFGNRPAECKPNVDVSNGVCSSDTFVQNLKKWLKTKNTDASTIINEAKEKLGVEHESQLYDRDSIKHLSTEKKDDVFASSGPHNTDEWLDNKTIDQTLDNWEEVFPKFKNMGVHMNNFDSKHKKLATADWPTLVATYDTIASVINTDNYGEIGQHWVCIVVNSKKKTIEYFDSAAGQVSDDIIKWMMKLSIKLNYKELFTNNIQHQEKNTECGVYSLFYVIARVHGVPSGYFDQARIPDQVMLKSVRKYLFRFS